MTEFNLKIEMIPIDIIQSATKNAYNDLPHFLYTNEEYSTQVYDTELSTWCDPLAHLMRTPYEWTFEFTLEELKDLSDACRSGRITNRRPIRLEDELNDIEERLKKSWHPGNWFVRFNAASPKDSYIPASGLTLPREVINCLVTSDRIMKNCLNERRINRNRQLYFAKFDQNWDIYNEWRVFVYNTRVIAISQYVWHDVALWYDQITKEHLQFLTQNIVNIVAKITELIEPSTFIADFYANPLQDSKVGLIEINNYTCAGACLFSWHNDTNILPKKTLDDNVSQSNDIVFRIVKR